MPLRLIRSLCDAPWLNRERIVAWGSVLLIVEILLLGFIALYQNGMVAKLTEHNSIDFVSFYAAGKLALAGTPALAYDQSAHHAMEQAVTVTGTPYQFFFYPPVFLMLCAALALLPYLVSYAMFGVVTLTMFLCAMRAILRETGCRWMVPVLAFPAVFWTVGLGQNAFLTAALFGGFTLMVDRRPVRAGMLLGMLCYKPHFGLLVPVALAASGRWRAFLAAAAAVALLVAASIALFGIGTWSTYFAAFAGSQSVYDSGRIDFAGMVTPFGAARLLGFTNAQAYGLQTTVALVMAATVALAWRSVPGTGQRAAILLSATLLAVPMALVYDKMLLLVAVAWIIRDARESGFLPWEKVVLTATYPLCLLTWSAGSNWQIPIGPFITAIVLLLCLRRIRRRTAGRNSPCPIPMGPRFGGIGAPFPMAGAHGHARPAAAARQAAGATP